MKLSLGSIEKTISRLENTKQRLKDLEDTLPEYLAKQTLKEIQKNYNAKGFTSDDDPVTFSVEKGRGSTKAIANGDSVAYEEFGTGDVGASHPHPYKLQYGLNPYNSGETIRPADRWSIKHGIDSGKYWTYEYNGERVYTQGIPAGKFMFNSDNWLRSNYKSLVAKKVDDALRKR